MDIRIDFNPRNFGIYTFFEYNGEEYYADLCDIGHSIGTECMIFASKGHQVTNWGELYCKRGIPVTANALRECVDEFIKQLEGTK